MQIVHTRKVELHFILSLLVVGQLALNCNVTWAQTKTTGPATALQAAAVLDLTQFEAVNPDEKQNAEVIARQSYLSHGKITEIGKKIQANFKKAGCKELDGTNLTDAYGSAMFQKQGFTFSLSLIPSKPGDVLVSITNHGNVDLKSIPVPNGSTQLYAFPTTIAYVSPLSVAETNKECRKLLLDKGWEMFGETEVSFMVKQNAVQLQVMASEAPAQGNKTVIQMSSEQLSADLPAPPYNGFLQYSDTTGGMLFDSDKSQEDLVTYFKQALGKWKWESTTEKPIRIDFRDHLIFRNPSKEYLELQFYEVEKKTRVDLKYQTAKQFAEEEKRAEEYIKEEKKKREAEMKKKENPDKIAIASPSNAKLDKHDDKSLEFSTDTGKAKASLTAWIKDMEKDGWKLKKIVDEKVAGEYELSKDESQLRLSFLDPGFIPGSISMRISGNYKLELKKESK